MIPLLYLRVNVAKITTHYLCNGFFYISWMLMKLSNTILFNMQCFLLLSKDCHEAKTPNCHLFNEAKEYTVNVMIPSTSPE